jgi:hypothetical protein
MTGRRPVAAVVTGMGGLVTAQGVLCIPEGSHEMAWPSSGRMSETNEDVLNGSKNLKKTRRGE